MPTALLTDTTIQSSKPSNDYATRPGQALPASCARITNPSKTLVVIIANPRKRAPLLSTLRLRSEIPGSGLMIFGAAAFPIRGASGFRRLISPRNQALGIWSPPMPSLLSCIGQRSRRAPLWPSRVDLHLHTHTTWRGRLTQVRDITPELTTLPGEITWNCARRQPLASPADGVGKEPQMKRENLGHHQGRPGMAGSTDHVGAQGGAAVAHSIR